MEFYTESYIHDRFINNNVKKHKITEYKLNKSLNIAIRYYKNHDDYFQQFIKMRLVFNTIKPCKYTDFSHITKFCEYYGIINNYKLKSFCLFFIILMSINSYIFNKSYMN